MSNIDSNAMFKMTYGLFVLTTKDDTKDNGCIINTAIQITDNPKRISITVNKSNYTHDLILKTGIFNVSILTTETPFKVFEHFGFQSGKTIDKFLEWDTENRTENGLLYIGNYSNAVLSGKVIKTEDYGTHTMFIAEVTEAKIISNVKSVTYEYYFANIKPRPQLEKSNKKRYVCKICGYVYEGDELPDDFICPICKHGASDFELILEEEKTMRKFICTICGYVYDEAVEKVKWEDLPDDWTCPRCGALKSVFEEMK